MTSRRTPLLVLLVLLAAGAATLLFQPRAEAAAADCDGQPGPLTYQWLETAEAQLRTLNGDCEAGAVCREWCLTSCGDPEPQNLFSCFPE